MVGQVQEHVNSFQISEENLYDFPYIVMHGEKFEGSLTSSMKNLTMTMYYLLKKRQKNYLRTVLEHLFFVINLSKKKNFSPNSSINCTPISPQKNSSFSLPSSCRKNMEQMRREARKRKLKGRVALILSKDLVASVVKYFQLLRKPTITKAPKRPSMKKMHHLRSVAKSSIRAFIDMKAQWQTTMW